MALSETDNNHTKICPKCGEENVKDASFCENCGLPIKRSGVLAKDYIPPKKEKSGIDTKIVVIILALVIIVGVLAGVLLKNSMQDNENQTVQDQSNTVVVKEENSQKSGFPIINVPNLAAVILNSNYPENINYGGYSLTKAQYLYIMARSIVAIDQGESGNIPIKSFGQAEAPYGTVSSADIARVNYVDMALRVSNWMDANGRAPNYAGIITPGADDLSTDMTILTFAKVLDYYHSTGSLPASVSVP